MRNTNDSASTWRAPTATKPKRRQPAGGTFDTSYFEPPPAGPAAYHAANLLDSAGGL